MQGIQDDHVQPVRSIQPTELPAMSDHECLMRLAQSCSGLIRRAWRK
jgi:hypothetical protein